MHAVISSCNANTSSSTRSYCSAQRWLPLSASISCAVMRTRLPALRTPPSSTYRTPNFSATSFAGAGLLL